MKAEEAKKLVEQAPIKNDNDGYLINEILKYIYKHIERAAFHGHSQITLVGFGYERNQFYIGANNISEEIINLILKDLTDNGFRVETEKSNYDDKNITDINWE